MEKRFLRTLFAIAIAIACLCSTVLLASGEVKADWSLTGTYGPSSAYIGDTVSFHVDETNPGNDPIALSSATYSIDWGKSGNLQGNMNIAAGATNRFTATFTVPQISTGLYTVTITFTGKALGSPIGDLFSSTHSYTCDLNVKQVPPLSVQIQADKTSGKTPLSVDFTSQVSGGVAPFSYYWTFGDGSTSSSPNPMNTYSGSGSYTAKLVVTDSKGQTASDQTTINVQSGGVLGSSDTNGGSLPVLLLLGIVAVVVVIVIAGVFMMKNKKASPPSPPYQPPMPPQNPSAQTPVQPPVQPPTQPPTQPPAQ